MLAKRSPRSTISSTERPTLQVLHGKMIHEAIPRGIGGKGAALEFFMRDAGVTGPSTTYFGDDITDEDAFRALGSHRGIGVLVGATASQLRAVSARRSQPMSPSYLRTS